MDNLREYDDWKLQIPKSHNDSDARYEVREYFNCSYCGKTIKYEGYCSLNCVNRDNHENKK